MRNVDAVDHCCASAVTSRSLPHDPDDGPGAAVTAELPAPLRGRCRGSPVTLLRRRAIPLPPGARSPGRNVWLLYGRWSKPPIPGGSARIARRRSCLTFRRGSAITARSKACVHGQDGGFPKLGYRPRAACTATSRTGADVVARRAARCRAGGCPRTRSPPAGFSTLADKRRTKTNQDRCSSSCHGEI